ncbi:Beta antigen [uncultured Roseburia sp.]|uniref:DUF5979 domain-containing protein n=1 Tax=Brotonthovivens ammoniilytica TaxID=2981725 RepID=A0ABT2THH8_9FIRM|nr:DUF5979 domain-containing protein [Brotonthovivens ammoniilytica]MCU6761024.1 DUF5979 domain-containing protein [Brotonthovivens ammoniilytica]SCI16639.1 Beta antigen [uncultured Roseburia sp.]
MRRKKKVLITVFLIFALVCSGMSSGFPITIYAKDNSLEKTSSEMRDGDEMPDNDVLDNQNNESAKSQEVLKSTGPHIEEETESVEMISENNGTGDQDKKNTNSEETQDSNVSGENLIKNEVRKNEKTSTLTVDTVAIVGDTEYASLDEAIKNITDDATVKVVSDIELSKSITIPKGVSVTLTSDENQHTVMMTSMKENSNYAAFVIEPGAALVIDSDCLTLKREKYQDYLSGLIACHGTFELKKGTLDCQGNEINDGWDKTDYAGGIVQVCGNKAVFIMDGGTIKSAVPLYGAGGVRVCCNGKFFMNNGTIMDINNNGQLNASAVIVLGEAGLTTSSTYFEMNGGFIENNTSYRGGGVSVIGSNYEHRAEMVMNAGVIRNNTCTGWKQSNSSYQAAGGGIYIQGNAVVSMEGGEISNNTVNSGLGGGVATADGYLSTFGSVEQAEQQGWPIGTYSKWYPAGFTMNGGTISGNKVTKGEIGGDGGCGGGIYSSSNEVTLKKGVIENNEAEKQGGGVYVGSVPYELTIHDAVVTGNKATILGGGVWACPTGDTEVFVTNGVGIYDNTSDGAGDDVVSVKTSGKNYILTLADRILGGGQVLWYKDGGLAADSSVIGNPDGSARYNPEGNDKPISQIKNSTEPYALKAVVSDNAKKIAESSADLFIRNNKAARGGGIGTNGAIIMGEKDNEYTLKVKKDWKDTDENLKEPVTVYLKVGDTVLDSIILDETNKWESEFTQLPAPDTLADALSYAVVEEPVPDNFIPSYTEAMIDHDARTITIQITNTYQPPKLGSLTVTKEVTGTHGDTDKEFHFTVILDDKTISGRYGDMEFKEGIAEFTLKDQESRKAEGLPSGTGYRVEEKEADQEGYQTTAKNAQGAVPENGNAEVLFTNAKSIKGSLTVTKEVAGTHGDTNKEFHFTVILDDKTISGRYGDMEFKEGIAEFTLKDQESRKAEELPSGTGYRVEEKEADQEGYQTTAKNAQGAVPENGNAEVLFINQKDEIPDKPSIPDEPQVPDKPSIPDEPQVPDKPSISDEPQMPDKPSVSNTTQSLDNPKTGDGFNMEFYISLAAISSLLWAIGIVIIKKKKLTK